MGVDRRGLNMFFRGNKGLELSMKQRVVMSQAK
jgi:hypothetical protein